MMTPSVGDREDRAHPRNRYGRKEKMRGECDNESPSQETRWLRPCWVWLV